MPAAAHPSRERFLALVRAAVAQGTLAKLTLGKYRGSDSSLRNLYIRPVSLRPGPRLTLVWRHATRDVTKNRDPEAALREIEPLIGGDFLHAHLFASSGSAQLECEPDGSARLKVERASRSPGREPSPPETSPAGRPHDEPRRYLIAAESPWLRALGVTNDRGRPREGMAPKFRQIQKFAELLSHLMGESGLDAGPLRVVDMGCGKGYLTFAVAALLGERCQVRGIEARSDLVELCNGVAVREGFAPRLAFTAGAIADAELADVDVLIALHACDTATDDALAAGIAAGAGLILAAPCCQKELRPQLVPPPVLADSLRHGILRERQAEFATDSLRAQLLEWAGYRTRVLEFVSTEHTAKNLMIAAVKGGIPRDPALAARIRAFAAFYGIRSQSLARQLEFDLTAR
jgi:SAM-dependent methyltransferase